jgi:hypothetical protein
MLVAGCVGRHKGHDTDNLTILTEKGYEDLPGFWAEKGVEFVTAPYYRKETVDRLRRRVFEASPLLLNPRTAWTGITSTSSTTRAARISAAAEVR